MVTLPQPAPLMMGAMVEKMKQAGVKSVAYIGYSDASGRPGLRRAQQGARPRRHQGGEQRALCARDSSVAGQVLKIVALRPDAVITGASGTPGALPYLALTERGYKGKIYGMHALINPDFVRVGGPSVDGLLGTHGPGGGGRAAARHQPDEEDRARLPRRLPEGQRRAADRHLLRPTASMPGCSTSTPPSARSAARASPARRSSASRCATPS